MGFFDWFNRFTCSHQYVFIQQIWDRLSGKTGWELKNFKKCKLCGNEILEPI